MRLREFADTKKLVIFDIDDTLVNTETKVHVVKDGRVVRSLNSHDFTHYKLQPGEEFDFEDFRNAREFFEKSKPIIPMINQLKRDVETGNKVVMVTARADFDDRETFLDTFRRLGIDMSRVHVYRAGNIRDRMATEKKKKIIIRDLLNKNLYDKAIMYDDALPNLHAFVSLKSEYPNTRFYAWHVDHDGRASEYHRTDESQTVPLTRAFSGELDESRAYHGGPEGITRFRPLTHFGSKKAALSRMAKKKIQGQVYEVELDITNPAVIKDFAGVHAPTQFAFALRDAGIIDHDEMMTVTSLMGQPELQTPILVALLKSKGHDGIAYRNRYEDPGHTSYVILDPDQAQIVIDENFADGRVKGKSRPGRVKRAGASCKGSVTDLRARAKKYGGERGKMYHWCANMKSGRKKSK
jgi:hypothetical protein